MKEDDVMPGLPPGVLREDRDKLAGYQRQIKVLVNNHQILVSRSEKNPQEHRIIKQVEEVTKYLKYFSKQQRSLLDKVRSYLNRIEEEKTEQEETTELGPPLAVPFKQETDVSLNPTKISGKQASKSRKEKRKFVKNSRSTTPEEIHRDIEFDPGSLAYFESDTCFRGHIEEYNILSTQAEEDDDMENFGSEEDLIFDRIETNFETTVREDFMLNIDLLTDTQYKMVLVNLEEQKKRKGKKRVNIYVPEIADKKYRHQTFLRTIIVSPPHLRRRKPNQLPSVPLKPTKSLSFPGTALFTVPSPVGKMGTRNKSPSLAKLGQIDGTLDLDDFEDAHMDSEDDLIHDSKDIISVNQSKEYDVSERLKVREALLLRKKKIEDEIELLNLRKTSLQECRTARQEEKSKFLKEQQLLEERIKIMLHVLREPAN